MPASVLPVMGGMYSTDCETFQASRKANALGVWWSAACSCKTHGAEAEEGPPQKGEAQLIWALVPRRAGFLQSWATCPRDLWQTGTCILVVFFWSPKSVLRCWARSA